MGCVQIRRISSYQITNPKTPPKLTNSPLPERSSESRSSKYSNFSKKSPEVSPIQTVSNTDYQNDSNGVFVKDFNIVMITETPKKDLRVKKQTEKSIHKNSKKSKNDKKDSKIKADSVPPTFEHLERSILNSAVSRSNDIFHNTPSHMKSFSFYGEL